MRYILHIQIWSAILPSLRKSRVLRILPGSFKLDVCAFLTQLNIIILWKQSIFAWYHASQSIPRITSKLCMSSRVFNLQAFRALLLFFAPGTVSMTYDLFTYQGSYSENVRNVETNASIVLANTGDKYECVDPRSNNTFASLLKTKTIPSTMFPTASAPT